VAVAGTGVGNPTTDGAGAGVKALPYSGSGSGVPGGMSWRPLAVLGGGVAVIAGLLRRVGGAEFEQGEG